MFNYETFITENLINGLKKGAFFPEQVLIFAMNYNLRGLLTADGLAAIQQAVTDYQAEQARLAEEAAKAEEEQSKTVDEAAEKAAEKAAEQEATE